MNVGGNGCVFSTFAMLFGCTTVGLRVSIVSNLLVC